MNRKKCYCSNKFCKCLFGCGCTISSSGYGKCMCCIMEENDKRLRRRGKVVTEKIIEPGEGGECKCNFNEPKFYDIIVFNNAVYWSCRYGCLVRISDGNFDPNDVNWEYGAVENPHGSGIQINYDISNIQPSSEEVNILIVKEENLKHVWCKVNKLPTE